LLAGALGRYDIGQTGRVQKPHEPFLVLVGYISKSAQATRLSKEHQMSGLAVAFRSILNRSILNVVFAVTLLFSATSVGWGASSDEEIIAKINEFLKQSWKDNDVTPSPRADDGEFARRVSLDILGRTPSFNRLMQFLGDTSPDKRARFVDELLDDPDYAEHFSTIWGNILIGRANNRRTNRGELERWLKRQFEKNLSYDQFTYELIAAEGESRSNGAVGFMAAHLNDNAVPATAITARILLGMQVQCTQCHNHPFNDWKQSQFWGMNAFFRGTRRQGAGGVLQPHHDAGHRLVCSLEHHIVVAVDRNVGVHIAITCMHMQSNPDTAFEHTLVDRVARVQDRLKLSTCEYVFEHSTDLRFPTRAQAMVLQLRKQCVAVIQPLLPSATHVGQHRTRLLHTLAQ